MDGAANPVFYGIFLIGRWHWKEFRAEVETLRECGWQITVIESPGWLRRIFIVRTAEFPLQSLKALVDTYDA